MTIPSGGTSEYTNCRPWQIRGHGISPADTSRYLIPRKIKETSEIPSESNASLLTRKKIRIPRASTIAHAVTTRTCSPPATISSSKYGWMKRWISEPYGLESSSGHFFASPKLYPARNPEGPATPHNSDELLGFGPASPQLWRSRSDAEEVEFNAQDIFAQNLRERLIVWAKPLILNPYKSIGHEYSGTDGRRTSPSMGWLVGSESAMISGSYIDGESGKDGCSVRSSISLNRRSAHVVRNRASDMGQSFMGPEDGFEPRRSRQSLEHNTEGSCSSDSAFQGNYLPGTMSLLPSKWSSLLTPRTQVSTSNRSKPRGTSPIKKSRLNQISDEWHIRGNLKIGAKISQPKLGGSASSNTPSHSLLLEPSVVPTVTPGADPYLRYESLKSTSLERRRYLEEGLKAVITSGSTPEQVFLDELDGRLNRLGYEVSPGFRGFRSRESTHRSKWKPVPCHFHVLDGMSQPMRPNPGRWSLELPFMTPPMSDISEMQPKQTKPRNKKTSFENRDLVRSEIFPRVLDPATATATATIRREDDDDDENEPREGAIDPAAWILRRPPMGARLSHTAEQALLYTDGRGTKPKPLAVWQQR